MQIFYYDKNMAEYEQKKEFVELIKYLEQMYVCNKSVLSALIVYSWYLYAEGEFINKQIAVQWEFYYNKWTEYLKVGADSHQSDVGVCFAMGYTLNLNWMHIYDSAEYEKIGRELLEFCRTISSNENVIMLIGYLLQERRYLQKEVLSQLFPTNSLIDTYFKGVIRVK